MTSNLLIVPTRNRPKNVEEFYECFIKKSSKNTTLCFGIDNDDDSNYDFDKMDRVFIEKNNRLGLNGTLNLIAKKYCNAYDYISFMGDDHRIRTKNWDKILISSKIKNVISYGNDLLQGENLPTAVLMDSNIIRKLGYMSPPNLKHMYLDNFWKDLGIALNTLKYYDNVTIEHMHYTVNKSDNDSSYAETNTAEIIGHDSDQYKLYKASDFQIDLEKLND